jgi:hypothetical protein
MDELMKKEIKKFKKRHTDFLKMKGQILFLYLDGIMTLESVNLSEMLSKDGLGYCIDKEWSDVNYYIRDDSLNKMLVETGNSVDFITNVFGVYQDTLFEKGEENKEEILSYLNEDEYKVKIKEIKKVREYNW